jgi:hypothetical protein
VLPPLSDGEAQAQRQIPSKHFCLPGHLLSQTRQWFLSVRVLTHLSPQSDSPALHDDTSQTPCSQVTVPPVTGSHFFPHIPQLFGSEVVLMQASPHLAMPGAHWNPQVPAAHVGMPDGGALHALSHSPQLAASVLTSTHEPPQEVLVPQPSSHVPDWQNSPVGQVLPQVPQLLELDVRSTHCPPQLVSPGLHLIPHLPALHAGAPPGVLGHTFPQAPQLFGSASKLKQALPHNA